MSKMTHQSSDKTRSMASRDDEVGEQLIKFRVAQTKLARPADGILRTMPARRIEVSAIWRPGENVAVVKQPRFI
jgi:hypothetical protein